MKMYKVDYISSTDGEYCSVYTEANSTTQAEDNTRNDYWDVEEIVSVTEI